MSDKVSQITSSFDICSGCEGDCCQDAKPPLTEERRKIIESHLKIHRIPVAKPFVNEKYSYPVVDEFGFCVFYDRSTKKCLIHGVKPETCRAGPITFGINRVSGSVEFFLKNAEICRFAPRLFQDKLRFEEHFKAAKREIMNLVSSLEVSALLAVLEIDEPQTFKIGETILPRRIAEKLELKEGANEK